MNWQLPAAMLLLGSSASAYRADLEISRYNLLFARASVAGSPVLALIDTGAGKGIQISSTLARELKVELKPTGGTIRRHGGKEFPLLAGRVDRLTLGDFAQTDVTVNVIEDDMEDIARQVGTEFSVVVGWELLSRFHTVIDYGKRTMEWTAEAPDR